jgi:hypothetical protein
MSRRCDVATALQATRTIAPVRRALWRVLALFLFGTMRLSALDDQAEDHHRAGVVFHLQRSLDEAAHEYDEALRLESPREPTADEFARVLRLAPKLFVQPDEPFPLKDVAAIVHPTAGVIAYHLLWDDDVDFPDDNDPSDHEVVWVTYDTHTGIPTDLVSLFHGRVVDGGASSVSDARQHDMRARVNVQWGKHGVMPIGWESIRINTESSDEDTNIPADTVLTLLEYNQLTWKKLSTEGTRGRAHPLAVRHGWPSSFPGDVAAFTSFTREIDIRPLLKERRMVLVSRWNSATLARRFLLYNFRPKLEWPQ